MEILNLSNGTLKSNESLKQGFCNKYKTIKIGSISCQKCRFFNNSKCLNKWNQKK